MFIFMPGDRVKYVGSSSSLNLSGKVGEVICGIKNEPSGFVVEFGDDSYVIDGRNLARHLFAPGTEASAPKRRRSDPDLD